MEFSKKNNTIFSCLSPKEKEDIIKDIKSTYISLRYSLGLPKDATFGLEVEYDDLSQEEVNAFVDSITPLWYPTPETSLPKGGEVTSPVLTDKFSNWLELKNLCSFLRIAGATTSESVGSHIHVGVANTLGSNTLAWLNFIKKWIIYEGIIYRFTNGESVTTRSCYISHCYPIALELYDMLLNAEGEINLDRLNRIIPMERFQAINFRNVKWHSLNNNKEFNTLELRTPNGTFEEAIWQNNVNFFVRFLLSCTKEQDEEYIKYALNKISNLYNYGNYYKMDIDKAFKLVDDIFTNELDKVYFLRQYIKDGEEIKEDGLVRTKSFVNEK